MDGRGHPTEPVSHGKATAPDRRPSPIHSSTSSVVAETSTGSQPIPSISSIRFFCSTTSKDVVGPCWVCWEAQKTDERGPRFLAPVAQQKHPAGSSVGVQFLRHGHQVADWMLPTRQHHRAFVAGGVLAERDVFYGAIGKGKAKCGLFVNSRSNRAHIRIISKNAQRWACRSSPI